MTEMGQSRRLGCVPVTSGLHPLNGHRQTAPVCRKSANNESRANLIDYFVGCCKQGRRYLKAECFGRPAIDDQFELAAC